MRILRIKTDGTMEIDDIDTELSQLQEEVGGYLQGLPLHDNAIVYMNEEGKLKGLPPNIKATRILHGEEALGDDVIMGNVIICGMDRSEGEEIDLPESVSDHLFKTYY